MRTICAQLAICLIATAPTAQAMTEDTIDWLHDHLTHQEAVGPGQWHEGDHTVGLSILDDRLTVKWADDSGYRVVSSVEIGELESANKTTITMPNGQRFRGIFLNCRDRMRCVDRVHYTNGDPGLTEEGSDIIFRVPADMWDDIATAFSVLISAWPR